MAPDPQDDSEVYYEFRYADGRRWQHSVSLLPGYQASEDLPEWTRLDFHQCGHCPLSPQDVPHCPFAAALAQPMVHLARSVSFDEVDVRVRWRGREIRQRTTLQRAMGSLLGAVGAASGCPHTRPLKAMAWFHWPFSSSDETLYRALGTYLLGQFLRAKRGMTSDWSLDGLRAIYRNLRRVNLDMATRLRAAAEEDASVNGLILLDLLAADTLSTLDQYEGELDLFFEDYFH